MSIPKNVRKPLKKDVLPVAEISTATELYASRPIKVATAARQLGVSSAQLLETAGVSSINVRTGVVPTRQAKAAQARLQEMLEILNRISAWAGGKEQALAWYRAYPIPAFGDRTAEFLVKDGKAAAVRGYLDHIALGGFA